MKNIPIDSTASFPQALLAAAVMLIAACGSAHADSTFTYTSTADAVTITGCSVKTGAVTVPATIGGLPVTSIGDSAFALGRGITSITLPDSVTSIGRVAFWECSALASINIPNSVTSIGHMAFGGCLSLTSITIPSGVTSIGYNTFAGCTGLTSVAIPSSVTSIEEAAFQACSGLTSITIPSGVTSIGDAAFADCTGLTSAIFPGDAPALGVAIFDNTDPGFTVYYQSGAPGFTSPIWNGYPAVCIYPPTLLPGGTADNPGGGKILTFAATADFIYQVEVSGDLTAWTELGSVTTGSDGRLVITDTGATAASRFYRFKK
jgi:BspA type Leucine rich repeat region (6 copies)